MLSEISLTEKNKYRMITLTGRNPKKTKQMKQKQAQIQRTNWQLPERRGDGKMGEIGAGDQRYELLVIK